VRAGAGDEDELDAAGGVGEAVTWPLVVCARAESVERKIENTASVAAAKTSPAMWLRAIPGKSIRPGYTVLRRF